MNFYNSDSNPGNEVNKVNFLLLVETPDCLRTLVEVCIENFFNKLLKVTLTDIIECPGALFWSIC